MHEEPNKDLIKQSLDALKNDLDVATQVKLNEARHAALNQSTNTPIMRWLMPAAGLATMAALAFTLVMFNADHNQLSEPEPSLFTDLELLAQEADPDFYQDLEFLTWLDDTDLMESDI